MALAAIASLSLHLPFFLLFLFLLFVNSLSDEPLPPPPPCPPFNCGNFSNISPPFTGTKNPICGSVFLECFSNETTKIRSLDHREYIVKNVSNSDVHSITIQDPLLAGNQKGVMCDLVSEFVLPNFTHLFLNSSKPIITILICKPDSHLDPLRYPNFTNYPHCNDPDLYYSLPHLLEDKALQDEVFDATKHECNPVPYPVSVMPDDWEWGKFDLISSLEDGFVLQWISHDDCATCQFNGGLCLVDELNNFSCHYCMDELYGKKCTSDNKDQEIAGRKSHSWLRPIIGISAAIGTLLLTCIAAFIFLCCRRRKMNETSPSSPFLTRSKPSNPRNKPDHVNSSTTQFLTNMPTLSLFTYSELQLATDNFNPNNELGNGGFGTVYYGIFPDGCPVAVKRLYENNYKRVEQFMNEIRILSGLRHPNLVCLYGCTSRHGRELLLVYEYIPNGTVADHIHGDLAKVNGGLNWSIRLNIAIETAEALAFLHAVDPPIVHRDVKTKNILLDNSFRVKVADFGLSRLFPLDVTHVSTAPQGTPGYVDPDYHRCYQLTDKSDVYSFGVVLAELISSKPAVDITRERHEINLAGLAVNKIINRALNELVDPNLGFESDCRVRKMVSEVAELAIKCLAVEKDERPTMEEVSWILKGIQMDRIEVKIPKGGEDIPAYDDGLSKIRMPVSSDSIIETWKSSPATPNTSNGKYDPRFGPL